jgi:hypothetical protein
LRNDAGLQALAGRTRRLHVQDPIIARHGVGARMSGWQCLGVLPVLRVEAGIFVCRLAFFALGRFSCFAVRRLGDSGAAGRFRGYRLGAVRTRTLARGPVHALQPLTSAASVARMSPCLMHALLIGRPPEWLAFGQASGWQRSLLVRSDHNVITQYGVPKRGLSGRGQGKNLGSRTSLCPGEPTNLGVRPSRTGSRFSRGALSLCRSSKWPKENSEKCAASQRWLASRAAHEGEAKGPVPRSRQR